MNKELASFILSRPLGFHDWAYPAGSSNAERRQKVVSELCPEMRGKSGLAPKAKCGVSVYFKSIVKALGIDPANKCLAELEREAKTQLIKEASK